MNFQLLIVIAVVLSSLLTLSQRANAQEISKQRWLEPNVEQLCCENVIPDQDTDPVDGHYFLLTVFSLKDLTLQKLPLSRDLIHSDTSFTTERIQPRAPPFFLI